LQAVTAACSEALTLDEIAEVVLDQGIALPGATSGLIALLADDSLALQIVRTHGYPPDTVAAWQSMPIEAALPHTEAARTGAPKKRWRCSNHSCRPRRSGLPFWMISCATR